jgi:hypothetical protein
MHHEHSSTLIVWKHIIFGTTFCRQTISAWHGDRKTEGIDEAPLLVNIIGRHLKRKKTRI